MISYELSALGDANMLKLALGPVTPGGKLYNLQIGTSEGGLCAEDPMLCLC